MIEDDFLLMLENGKVEPFATYRYETKALKSRIPTQPNPTQMHPSTRVGFNELNHAEVVCAEI